MNTLMIGKRYPAANAVMALMILALLAVMLVSTVDAAPVETDVPIEDRAQMQQTECETAGGTPYSHYFYDADGLATAQVICEARGWVCDNTRTTEDCYTVGRFAQLTPAVVPDQNSDTAAPSENLEATLPASDENAAPPGDVTEDPTAGDGIAARQNTADQAGACETFGGNATVTDNRLTGTIDVRCEGGMMDGMSCINGHYDTFCNYFRVTTNPEQDAQAPPTGGVAEDPTGTASTEITFVRVKSEAELEAALHGVAEDPTSGDTVVIVYQSGLTLNEKTNGQGAICEGLGGIPVNVSVEAGAHVFVCVGGLLDGLTCFNGDDSTYCTFVSSFVLPVDGPEVTPAAGVEAPAADAPMETVAAEPPTPTPASVAPPPTPTPAPTAVAAEPTVAPPSDPPPPKNDTNMPPSGPVEDPTESEPPATEAPLL